MEILFSFGGFGSRVVLGTPGLTKSRTHGLSDSWGSTESLALSLRQPEVARLIIIDIYNINRLAELLVYPLQDT